MFCFTFITRQNYVKTSQNYQSMLILFSWVVLKCSETCLCACKLKVYENVHTPLDPHIPLMLNVIRSYWLAKYNSFMLTWQEMLSFRILKFLIIIHPIIIFSYFRALPSWNKKSNQNHSLENIKAMIYVLCFTTCHVMRWHDMFFYYIFRCIENENGLRKLFDWIR